MALHGDGDLNVQQLHRQITNAKETETSPGILQIKQGLLEITRHCSALNLVKLILCVIAVTLNKIVVFNWKEQMTVASSYHTRLLHVASPRRRRGGGLMQRRTHMRGWRREGD